MEMSRMTARELVELYDARCAPENRIGGGWKRPKAELIAMIEALGEAAPDVTRPEPAEPAEATDRESDDASNTKPNRTVGLLVKELLMDEALDYAAIVERVVAEFPEAKTSARSVASVATDLRKKGTQVPIRRKVNRTG